MGGHPESYTKDWTYSKCSSVSCNWELYTAYALAAMQTILTILINLHEVEYCHPQGY